MRLDTYSFFFSLEILIYLIGRDLEQGPYENYLADIVEEDGNPENYTEPLHG